MSRDVVCHVMWCSGVGRYSETEGPLFEFQNLGRAGRSQDFFDRGPDWRVSEVSATRPAAGENFGDLGLKNSPRCNFAMPFPFKG